MGYHQKYKRIGSDALHASRSLFVQERSDWQQTAVQRGRRPSRGFTLHERGFSLFEVLIAISVFAVVGVLAAQLIGISLQSETVSAQKTAALQLAQEESEAVDSLALEYWHNIYGLTKGSGAHYYAWVNSNKWATSTGDEIFTLNNTPYKRYFYIENVSRDATTKDIEQTYTASREDPSTQKVTAIVSWQNSGGLDIGAATTTKYIMRARNAAASQTDWSGAVAPTAGETGAFGTNYAAQLNIDTSGGTLKLTP